MRRKIIFGICACLLGLVIGVSAKAILAGASSPETGCPVGTEAVPSVVYDEVWEPLNALVTVEHPSAGFKVGNYSFSDGKVDFPGASSVSFNSGTVVGRVDDQGIKTMPKMKVIRWEVRGHVHFTK
jgi:hypothetical protein